MQSELRHQHDPMTLTEKIASHQKFGFIINFAEFNLYKLGSLRMNKQSQTQLRSSTVDSRTLSANFACGLLWQRLVDVVFAGVS